MTLTQMLRPVQKSLSRLLLAGTNNAVGQNAAVDSVAFRDQQQEDFAHQPHQQHQQQIRGVAEVHQLGASASASTGAFDPFGPAEPAALSAPTVGSASNGFGGGAGGCGVEPHVAHSHSGWSVPAFPQPTWQVCGRWPSSGADHATISRVLASLGANGSSSSSETAVAGHASSSATLSKSESSSLASPAHADALDGVPWQFDARWPMGTVMWSVMMPVWEQADAGGMMSEHSSELMGPASTASAALPGRTGASRRQRRKQQQQQQLQVQMQEQQDMLTQGQHHYSASAPMGQAHPAMPSLAMPQGFAQRPEVEAGKGVAAPACVACEGKEQLSTAATIDDSTESSAGDGSSDVGAHPSLLFPPTPECSPCNSPRFFCATGHDAFWPVEFPQAITQSGRVPAMPSRQVDAAASSVTRQRADKAEAPAQHPVDARCEETLSKLDSADASVRQDAVDWVAANVWTLATSASGCRAVQHALEIATISEQVQLAEQLRGHVREACTSPHANHVLQKCVEILPPDHLQFVLDEMKGNIVNASRHRYGCRVLERLIEHCPSWQTQDLVEEVLRGAAQLCRHTFGNFVVQHVLEHGTPEQRSAIVEMLHSDIQRLARHRVASHVVRAALVHCAHDDRQRLVDAMRADAAELADLAHHHCGSFVVREMRREMRR